MQMDRTDADRAEPAVESRPGGILEAGERDETLIQQFKRYYGIYRQTSDPDKSFSSAYEALLLTVLDKIRRCADEDDLESIRNLLRECDEIRHSVQGSNDSVKERFEREYTERSRADKH
jgi:hypothetical protein